MAGTTLKLIVGLGNPGEKYARTRHNAGFWFVDELARRHGGVFRVESKHLGEVARIRVTAEGGATPELWLLKPGTYMNKSGGSIASLANFYKVAPGEVLVAHDELDLPVGTARLKLGGGHGGHNGLRDTIAAIGADFWRLRVGIAHPGHKDLVLDYVLQRASSEDERAIHDSLARAADALPVMLGQGAEKAMNRLHTQD
ncbi:MAG: aminoacyl-tRNA hydrolase [Gammaproteobacteria bacterium]|nr:aminoacyl-tRNA hydrolase [Gammaproteobacteria bacterium]